VATGDGVAMAYRAGAAVEDLEFVQFHPTALNVPDQPRFLLSEALRGEGARLLNADGDAFMARYDPAGDLASRDRVSRAIVREAERTGRPIFLSLDDLDPDFVHERFPLISDACRRAGLDLARDRIPVGPAAHYVMGGVRSDIDGRTTLPGLFAAGEVACTGVHGANRLASNSLLEGLVFGARAGQAMREGAKGAKGATGAKGARGARDAQSAGGDAGAAAMLTAADIQAVMWRDVGLFRDRAGLERALQTLEGAWTELDAQLRNGDPLDADHWRRASLLTVGRLIARAALRREESRGGHYRSDFPRRDDINWKRRITETR
jgi:L-aspartate oxidase